MPSLVAVLDTNFWLASHVTMTIGYGAGLSPARSGVTISTPVRLPAQRPGFRTLASMTYGMLCFGLLFSVVGTVLGGIWATTPRAGSGAGTPRRTAATIVPGS